MAYVYQHNRKDTGEVFYIGIGSDVGGEYTRAYNKHRRSQYWHNIVDKSGYTVNIILDDISWGEACYTEQYLITYYGRKNKGRGPLVNLTDGGDGGYGRIYVISEETKQKLRKPRHSEEQKQKWSQDRTGKPNPKGGGKNKPKPGVSEAHKGRISPNKGKGKSVVLYNVDGKFIKQYNSYYDLAIDLNIHPETVRCHLIGKANTICNKQYKVKYVLDDK
jgi:hypothetical protein